MRGIDFSLRLIKRMGENDSAGLAAEMTYNWTLALIPVFIFIITLFGMFGIQTNLFEQILTQLNRIMPDDAFDMLQVALFELRRDSSGGLAILSLLGALWTASNGATTVEKALNRSYRCADDKRNFFQRRAIALLIVLGLTFLLFIGANLIVFGDIIFNALAYYLYLPGWLLILMNLARWTIPIIGLILIGSFIYYLAPNYTQEQKKRGVQKTILPGAVTFVCLWIFISWLFSLYVNNMANFNKIYGPMGALVVLMLWFYLTSYALIIGGEVNAIITGCDYEDGSAQTASVTG